MARSDAPKAYKELHFDGRTLRFDEQLVFEHLCFGGHLLGDDGDAPCLCGLVNERGAFQDRVARLISNLYARELKAYNDQRNRAVRSDGRYADEARPMWYDPDD